MVGQHDILFGDPQLGQLLSDPHFGPVLLNPDFTVFDIQMDKTTIQPFLLIPSGMNNLIVIVLDIGNVLNFRSIGYMRPAMALHDFVDALSIPV